MAVPQEFSKLFTDLEDTVIALSKQEQALRQSCLTLASRQTFLKTAIQKLEATQAELLAAQTTATDQAKAEQAAAEQRLVEANETITQLERDYQLKQRSLQADIVAAETRLVTVNQEIKANRKVLKELADQQTNAQTALSDVELAITAKQAELAHFDGLIVERQQLADEEIELIEDTVAKAKQQLVQVYDQVAEATDQLEALTTQVTEVTANKEAAEKQHTDFLVYEKRANEALNAKEDSLLEREQQLETNIVTSRRRHQILDNLE